MTAQIDSLDAVGAVLVVDVQKAVVTRRLESFGQQFREFQLTQAVQQSKHNTANDNAAHVDNRKGQFEFGQGGVNLIVAAIFGLRANKYTFVLSAGAGITAMILWKYVFDNPWDINGLIIGTLANSMMLAAIIYCKNFAVCDNQKKCYSSFSSCD